MKLILATESQPMAQALQLINSVTGEEAESIYNKYSQRDTMVGLAEAQVLPLEKCSSAFLERKREGQRGKRERDRWGAGEEGRAASAAVRTKLTSSVTSSTFLLEAWPHFKFLSSLQTRTSLPSPKSGPTAWCWGQFSPLVLKSFIWKRTGKDTAQRAHRDALLTRISRTGQRQPWAPQPRSTPARLQTIMLQRRPTRKGS